MDTAKVSNLFLCHPDNDIADFLSPPMGKGLSVPNKLKPLICGKKRSKCHILLSTSFPLSLFHILS